MNSIPWFDAAALQTTGRCVVDGWMTATLIGLAALLGARGLRLPASHRATMWCAAMLVMGIVPIARVSLDRGASPARSAGIAAPYAAPHRVDPAELRGTIDASWSPPSIPPSWAEWIGRLWWAGFVIALCALARDAVRIARWRRDTAPAPRHLLRRFRACRRTLGCRRRATLAVRDYVGSPVVIGGAPPTVVLPHATIDALERSELDAVLLHELAHVSRMDDVAHVAQRLLLAMMWMHPLAWIVSRRLDADREIDCDDRAANALGSRRAVARGLLRACEVASANRALTLAPAALRRGALGLRIRRLAHELPADAPPPRRRDALAVGVVPIVAIAGWALPAPALTATPRTTGAELQLELVLPDRRIAADLSYRGVPAAGHGEGDLHIVDRRPSSTTEVIARALPGQLPRWEVRADGRAIHDPAERQARIAAVLSAMPWQDREAARNALRDFGLLGS